MGKISEEGLTESSRISKSAERENQIQMSNDTKKPSNGASAASGGFRAKLDHYIYSGEKKHVVAGIAIFGFIFGVPWYLMTRGAKHQSHQDYLEKADKARNARLSTGSSTTR